MVGPLLVTEIYQEFGTYAMLIVVGVTMVRLSLVHSQVFIVLYQGLAFILVSVGFKTMVPAHKKKSSEPQNNSGGAGIEPIREESENESSETEEDDKGVKAKFPEFGRKLPIYEEEDKSDKSIKSPYQEDEGALQSGMFVI